MDFKEADASGPAIPPEVSSPVSKSRKMDHSLARNLAWRATGDWISQIFAWASFLIVIRLLTPADFGIVAMAVILLPFLQYFSEFGIPRAIVTLRDLTDHQIAELNTVGVALGVASFVVAAALAKPFAEFFRTPGLTTVVIVTCLALIPYGLRNVSEGLLSKEMRFRELSLFGAASAMTSAVLTLAFAYSGMGYWALVLGNLMGVFLRTALVVRARPFKFAMPSLDSIREPLRFGWHVLVSLVALNSYQRLDNVTAGRVLGQAALGAYGMAWTLANVPLEKVTSLVTTVVPSYLAAVQSEPASLRRYVRNLTETMALVTFPATVGLGLVAREMVPLVLGHKWDGVIVPLEVLSIYAAFRSIVALLPKVLTSIGNARYVMWNDLAALVILPIAFYMGSRWGVAGIAWGWVAAYPLVALPLFRKTFESIDMKVSEYWRALRPGVDGTVLMALAVGFVKYGISPTRSLLTRLVAEIAAGALVYTCTVLLCHKQRMLAFVQLARNLRARKA